MRFSLTTRHFESTEALEEFVTKKVSKWERFEHHIIDSEFILSRDSVMSLAEGKVNLKRETFTAKAKAPDMYAAISNLIAKLTKQLSKYDERLKAKNRLSSVRG
jgi:putative sigma-54 modulation protein